MNHDIQVKIQELMTVAIRAVNMHLQTGTGGNISIRCSDPEIVVIKPSSVGFAEVNADNLMVVKTDGTILSGDGKPSKDMDFHLGIYRVRPEVGGIVHVHSPWATSWATAGKEVPVVTNHCKAKLGRIPLVSCGPDGGNQVSADIIALFEDVTVKACVLEKHGSVGVGKTLLAAEHVCELIEETAHIAFVSAQIGNRGL